MPKKATRSCKEKLSEKIRINMREYTTKGRWVSPQQAIAVSYSQVLKKSPSCKKVLAAKRSTKSARSSRAKKSARSSRTKKSRSKKN